MDPWYDYLALPIAPLVLLVQSAALFIPWRSVRWAVTLACFGSIVWMFDYVASVEVGPDEGVNIGAGVMVIWLFFTVLLLAVGLGREGWSAFRWLTRRSRPG